MPEMKEWETVFKTETVFRAEIVKGVLDDNDISAIIINKKDSSYHFGHFEVTVPRDSIMKAIKIIRDEIRFE
jgi:hypothetical protein